MSNSFPAYFHTYCTPFTKRVTSIIWPSFSESTLLFCLKFVLTDEEMPAIRGH